MTPLEVLKKYWNYDRFRPLQEDIIQSALKGQDTLALLPTGGGKSICFQVPALCKGGVCLVISPLIALMKDQVQNLQKRGIAAAAIYSGMPYGEIDRLFDMAVKNQLAFLYLSPERLGTTLAKARIAQMPLSFIAVDEAHCISQWGYDFRPSYLEIAQVRQLCPKVPIIALTATATETVVEDIQARLEFKAHNKQVFQKSYARPNLAYVVLQEENKWAKLLDILQKVTGSGVVYVQNRKETKEVAYYLSRNGIKADYYHAGLSSEQRAYIQDEWIQNRIRIIVATNAFGMGIDKPDVRIVVHLTLPESLEAYFQEAGRGGRDEQKAYAVLLYHPSDELRLKMALEQGFPPLTVVRQVYRALGSYCQLAIGAGQGQSFDFDVIAFAEKFQFKPLIALNALKLLMYEGYLDLSEQVFFPSTVQFLVDKETLYDYQLRNPKLDLVIKALLRSLQGVHQHRVQLREGRLAGLLKMPLRDLVQQLQKLHQDKIIEYQAQRDNPQITFLQERLDADQLSIDHQRYHNLQKRQEERIAAALHYAQTPQCRSQMLLAYFNELDAPTCGKCDVCLGRHQEAKQETEEQMEALVLALLRERAWPLHELLGRFSSNQQPRLTAVLQRMIEEGQVEREEDTGLLALG
jgi:ATP-dependent DNA helicase RecQ